jgi:hypothetical protein
MKRSARSIPTGPGSRGGRWHDPEFRRAYYRQWRHEHPWYLEDRREQRRVNYLRRDRWEVDQLVARLTPRAIRPPATPIAA